VCFVDSWAHRLRGLGKFTVDDIDPTLCTHLVYAFAVLNTTTNTIESAYPGYDLEGNNGTGLCILSTVGAHGVQLVHTEYSWCIELTVQIVSCINLSKLQKFQCRTPDCVSMNERHWT
jgi:hypothetical protein